MSASPGEAMNRAYRYLLPIAFLAAIPLPAAAQEFSEAYTFLKAVRDRDGAKVQEIVSDPSSGTINVRDSGTGEGALHIVVRQRNIEYLAFLLGRGARADLQANDGTTPLGLAAQLGWVDGATQLILRGARVDLPNNRGETPLILAVQARQLSPQERLAMIELLVGRGADPKRQDSFAGYSALDYARQDRRDRDIVTALETKRGGTSGGAVGPNP